MKIIISPLTSLSAAPASSSTVAAMIKELSFKLKNLSPEGWHIITLSPGDSMQKNKSSALGLVLELKLSSEAISKGLKGSTLPKSVIQYPQSHRFEIQAIFSRDPKSKELAMASTWLSQAGQIISFGAPAERYTQGNLNSFIKAIQKLIDQDVKASIVMLYKSGYNQYGRE